MGSPIVGIDLGTTNSVVACVNENGDPVVLADAADHTVHPSIVSFHPNGSVLVGADARPRRIIDPQNTIYSAKRLIGRTFSSREVSASRQRLPYRIVEGANEQPVVVTRAGEFAIPEISALLLDHLRAVASQRLGTSVDRAVITVPAIFTESQRSATATAGAIAGVTVVRVLNEPSAAAMAYGHRKKLDETVAVYDFGGGTFDVSILKVVGDTFEVLGTSGDSFLGGDDIDDRLVEQMASLFLREHKINLHDNETAIERLRIAVEIAKVELGARAKARVNVQEIAYGTGGKPIHLNSELSREELNAMAKPIIERTFPVCEEALKMAGLKREGIGTVLLTGGTTRMPLLRSKVAQFFNKEPRTDLSPDEAVAQGASLQAFTLSRILDGPSPARASAPPPPSPPRPPAPTRAPAAVLTPPANVPQQPKPTPNIEDEWTEPDGKVPQTFAPPTPFPSQPLPTVPGHRSAAPLAKDLFDSGDSRDLSPSGDSRSLSDSGADFFNTAPAAPAPAWHTPPPQFFAPAPEVAPPAAAGTTPALAPVFTPASAPAPVPGPQILDVTPHSLCLSTVGGFCSPLISRSARVPIERRQVFSTSHDAQNTVRIKICQGESRRMDENQELGFLVLENLPPRPRGQTRIEVTFRIDESGMVQVHALDQDTGQRQSAWLAIRGVASPEEVEHSKFRIQALKQ